MAQQVTMHLVRRTLGAVRSGWQRYSRLMHSHGWRAQAVNTGVLMATGDLLAQCVIERRRPGKDYDPLRTLRFGAGGMLVFGPTMHVWYSSLDRFIRIAKTPLRLAVQKMLCDQLMFMPLYLASYISLFAVLEGSDAKETKERLETTYSRLLIFSYKLWPAVQIANFYFVPLHHRIFVINTVGLIYYTYIDWALEQTSHAKDKRTLYCQAASAAVESDNKKNTRQE